MYHLGDYDAAIRDFGKALRINWRDETIIDWLRRSERAREDSRKDAGLDPTMAPVLVRSTSSRSTIGTRN